MRGNQSSIHHMSLYPPPFNPPPFLRRADTSLGRGGALVRDLYPSACWGWLRRSCTRKRNGPRPPGCYIAQFGAKSITLTCYTSEQNDEERDYEELARWGLVNDGIQLFFTDGRTRWVPTDDPIEVSYDITCAIAMRMEDLGLATYDGALTTMQQWSKGLRCSAADSSDTECAICFEPLNRAVRLQCNHVFHPACARRWHREGNQTCCLCRADTT